MAHGTGRREDPQQSAGAAAKGCEFDQGDRRPLGFTRVLVSLGAS